jgi:cob(I)alamin adenosyltransferase
MITTREGDKGITKFWGREVEKDNVLMETIGTIDELQSCLGLSKSLVNKKVWKEELSRIQKNLFNINGKLMIQDSWDKDAKEVGFLDERINEMQNQMPTLRGFAIAGENSSEAVLQLSRAICRRVERRVVGLKKEQEVDENILKYFNRLSDYLFLGALEQIKK